MAHITEHRTRAFALSKQACLVVRSGGVCFVTALLTMPVIVWRGWSIRRGVVFLRSRFRHKTLVSGPRLNQRAVDAEVFPGKMSALTRGFDCLVEQQYHYVMFKQSLAVLAERRVVPHSAVHRQSDEPTEQHVVRNLFHQHALAANRVQNLQ